MLAGADPGETSPAASVRAPTKIGRDLAFNMQHVAMNSQTSAEPALLMKKSSCRVNFIDVKRASP